VTDRPGGAPSFAQVADALIPQALRAARLVLGQRSGLAEDAVQEALLRAYRAWPALPDKGRDPWPWLRTIVVHEARRLGARNARTAPGLPSGPEEEAPGNAPDPLESVVLEEERAEAARALLHLPALYRVAAELRYTHGLSCAEAAAVLGTPVGTVKWRLHEAHSRVRAGLDDGRLSRATAPEADSVPPCRTASLPAAPGVTALPGPWPPRALEVPGGARPRFAVASRVGGRSPAYWVGTDRGHHLWWSAGPRTLRASGAGIAAVRALAEASAGG